MTAAVLIALALTLATTLWARFAPIPASVWHVDPSGAPAGNGVLVSPSRVYPGTPAEVVGRIAEAALAEPRTSVLAGSAEEGWVSLVQRTAIMGFPDVITIRGTAVEGGTALVILSRPRFQGYDWGVNAARVERWLAAVL